MGTSHWGWILVACGRVKRGSTDKVSEDTGQHTQRANATVAAMEGHIDSQSASMDVGSQHRDGTFIVC